MFPCCKLGENTVRCFCCVLTMGIGWMLVIQTIINGSLSQHFSISIWGSVVSFGTALVLLTVLVYLEFRQKNGFDGAQSTVLRMSMRPLWYQLLPGLIGVVLVTAALTMAEIIGTALFYLPVVVGQILCSTYLDYYGVARPAVPMTSLKAFSLCLTLCGAVLAVLGKLEQGLGSLSVNGGLLFVLMLIAFLIGLTLPLQAMINREVAAKLLHGSMLQATWYSFFEGLLIGLFVLFVELCIFPARAQAFPQRFHDSEFYMWFGGPLGLVYVYSAVSLTGIIGFELYFVSLVTGQLSGSLVSDSVGLLTVPQSEVRPIAIVGVALVVVSIALNALRNQLVWLLDGQQTFGVMKILGPIHRLVYTRGSSPRITRIVPVVMTTEAIE